MKKYVQYIYVMLDGAGLRPENDDPAERARCVFV